MRWTESLVNNFIKRDERGIGVRARPGWNTYLLIECGIKVQSERGIATIVDNQRNEEIFLKSKQYFWIIYKVKSRAACNIKTTKCAVDRSLLGSNIVTSVGLEEESCRAPVNITLWFIVK